MQSREPIDVTKFSHREAIDHFYDRRGLALQYFKQLNVGSEGLAPIEARHFFAALNDQLNDQLSAIHTDTRIGKRVAQEIQEYLRSNGYGRGDVKMTRTQIQWTEQAAKGHSMISWWLLAKLNIEKWWLRLRNKRK